MSQASLEIFPHSFEVVVGEIGSLSDQAYETLRADVEGEDAFTSDTVRCQRLSPLLELAPEDVGLVLAALEFLYERIKNLQPSKQASEMIRRFVDGFEEVKLTPDVRAKLIDRLIELTAQKERVELARKIRRLRTGFLDNATAFSTFVDLRPDFNSDYESVRSLVPIIQLMISTDSDDPARQHFVFQMDERRLAGLKDVLDKAEKKLKTLQTKGVDRLQIMFEKEAR
jgi:hypothetical protein